ncbi:MAG: hypothetical protein ACTSVC_15710 [Promethearchaeota archaeon]
MVMIDNFGSIIFLWTYMAIIWAVVIKLFLKKPQKPKRNNIWKYLFLSFFLLAFGDSFHLLPRTYLWYLYTFQNQVNIYNTEVGIMIYAIGLMATGITMTFFYLMFYYFWKDVYLKDNGIKELQDIKTKVKIYDQIAVWSVIIRIILIFMPWNRWGTEPTYYFGVLSFRIITNIPLYVIGFEVLILFIKSVSVEGINEIVPKDINYAVKNSAIWIIVSYTCYTITIFGVPINPLYGMFMIPKTIAYIVVVYYLYKYILVKNEYISA